MNRSAIVLAGGGSSRMKSDKGLKELGGEPLVRHVMRRVSSVVDETLVVLSSEEQKERYENALGDRFELLVDIHEVGSPLVGALTGLRGCHGHYAFVTSCDVPFVSPDAVSMLFERAEGSDGATFQWPNGWVEPLMAVYRVEPSLKLAEKLFSEGELRLRKVLTALPRLKTVPIDRLRAVDPKLLTLYDIDTEEALLEAESMLKRIENS